MPGSLLLASNDTYSDLSYTSGRSLDSKTGTKKVSFNKAVRVKQYPWKPDLERNTAEHLTLPSNRFWFKVYKNKNDTPPFNNYTEQSLQMNAWGEDNPETIHDSLAPIAEVEDQDLDSNNLLTEQNGSIDNIPVFHDKNDKQSEYFGGNHNNLHYHPTEPPVDYFDEMHMNPYKPYGNVKTAWEKDEKNSVGYHYNRDNLINTRPSIRNGYGKYHEILEEPEENLEECGYNGSTDFVPQTLKLPRMAIRNDSPVRHSARKLDTSQSTRIRERRSRSHDDHADDDCRFKQLRRADKSVSTEDLNFNSDRSSLTNRFLKGSRDIATQCYGTLNREKNMSTLNSYGVSGNIHGISNSSIDFERLNSFKSPTVKTNFNEERLSVPAKTTQLKKDHPDEFSKRVRSHHDYQTKNNILPSDRNLNYKKYEFQSNNKFISSNRVLNRSENSMPDPVQKQNGRTGKLQIPRTDLSSNSTLYSDSRKLRENSQTKPIKDSATVGYLRGRQIPLSEVNTNTNRKFISKNETGTGRNLFFRKSENNLHPTPSPSRVAKSEGYTTNGIHPRKYTSNFENTNGRYKNEFPHSAKSYSSFHSDGDSSMIDWSLSGFQLATKPDNGITSISDSEYTVHRRPPLLMYIPGVSHHDRPAVEDDRLSALSDISRSEMNDGLSSLASNASKGKSSTSDIRRRHSMPRDGKLKWIKWKNKS